MERDIELKLSDAKQVFYALDQALPELQELSYSGDIKETIPEAVEKALQILREAMA